MRIKLNVHIQQTATGSTTVRDATMSLLRALGMTTVFGNPGSTELAFLHDWPRDFRYILGLQESIVVAMADGYAQATGTAAFVNLHSAAGVGHALGSVYTAYRNQTPLVITAGQQTRDLMPLRPFLGAAAAAEFPRPYVKWSCEPARGADVPLAIAQAHHIAMQKPCGPTFVSIPADDWAQQTQTLPLHVKSREFAPDPVLLRTVADAINVCQRPALVVGAGVACDNAADLVLALAETMQARVWSAPLTSRSAFPEDHPLFAGFLPASPDPLYGVLGGYDLVLVLGAPAFTFHVTGNWECAQSSPVIYQITDDPEAAATALAATSILGTMRLATAALLELVAKRVGLLSSVRTPAARLSPTDPIAAAFVMQTIADIRPSNSVIVEEAPSHKLALQRHLPINNNAFYSVASGGLGYGLAAAAGIALADPSRHVICIVGDGSAMYSIQALWTAAHHRLPITYVVLNNGGYGALRAFSQIMKFEDIPGIDLPSLDFVALALGHGCNACRVSRAADLEITLHRAFSNSSPSLVEVVVDRTVPPLFTVD
jgi:benzoylformate decarboxylase